MLVQALEGGLPNLQLRELTVPSRTSASRLRAYHRRCPEGDGVGLSGWLEP